MGNNPSLLRHVPLGRALLYSEGYREKSHRSLLTALRELLIKSGKMEEEVIQNFEDVMDLREEADYELEFSESGAKEAITHAKKFLKASKENSKSNSPSTIKPPKNTKNNQKSSIFVEWEPKIQLKTASKHATTTTKTSYPNGCNDASQSAKQNSKTGSELSQNS